MNSGILDASDWMREKLSWHLQVLCDPSLKDRAKILASLLLHDFNMRTGDAWRGQLGVDGLAARAGWKGARVVQLALAELESAGYLERDVPRGRGRSNRYRPVFKKTNEHSPIGGAEKANARSRLTTEKVNAGSPISPEKANGGAVKGERSFALTLRDTGFPPISPGAPAEGTVEGLSEGARTAFAANYRRTLATLEAVPEEIRAELAAIPGFGEGWIVSWLDPCVFDPDTRQIHAPSTLTRGRLREAIGHMLAGWQVTLGEALPVNARGLSA